MPFTEEAPKPDLGCKNRKCPFQRLYVDHVKQKQFLTYQCSDPNKFIVCLRWVDPKSHIEKPQTEPAATPTPKPAPATPTEAIKETFKEAFKPKQPTEEQLNNRCSNYPAQCCVCSPKDQDKCGVEEQYRKPPA